jgi:hypothetical protein
MKRSVCGKKLRVLLQHTENHISVLEFYINFTVIKSNREKCKEIARNISSDNGKRPI